MNTRETDLLVCSYMRSVRYHCGNFLIYNDIRSVQARRPSCTKYTSTHFIRAFLKSCLAAEQIFGAKGHAIGCLGDTAGSQQLC